MEYKINKFQIPSTKLQINLKFQYSTRGASACAARDLNSFACSSIKIIEDFRIFVFWSLFDICDLVFGIYFSVFETDITPLRCAQIRSLWALILYTDAHRASLNPEVRSILRDTAALTTSSTPHIEMFCRALVIAVYINSRVNTG
jgi:hypothetical protein